MARPVLRRIHRRVAVVDIHKAHVVQRACAGYHGACTARRSCRSPQWITRDGLDGADVLLHVRVLRRARRSRPLSAAHRLRPLPLLLPSMLLR